MEFNIVDKLLGFTLLGSEWVLWLLVLLSVFSIGIMIERALFFIAVKVDFSSFSQKLSDTLAQDKYDEAEELCRRNNSVEARVALCGLENRKKGVKAMEGTMEGMIVGEKHRLDRGLVVLGTLGNNAPFIGLFGTVIGIIQAFHDLAANPEGGPSVVMAGISEALVATAVGLLVAIPAVVTFNAYTRVVKKKIANAQAVAKLVTTHEL